jgi:hypothetical protein
VGKLTSGLVAIVLAAACIVPAGASAKDRVVRPVPSKIPPPAYGFRGDGRAHSSNPAFDVYINGVYASSDPDPRIRAQIARDPWSHGK